MDSWRHSYVRYVFLLLSWGCTSANCPAGDVWGDATVVPVLCLHFLSSCSVWSHDAPLTNTFSPSQLTLGLLSSTVSVLPPAPSSSTSWHAPSVSVFLPLLLTCRWRPWSASLTDLWDSTSRSSPPQHLPPCTPTARRVPSPPAPPTLTLFSR